MEILNASNLPMPSLNATRDDPSLNEKKGAIRNFKKIRFQKITKGVANFSMPIVNRSDNETSKKEQASKKEQGMGQKLERNICAYDDINQIFARIKVVERPQQCTS